MNYSDEECREIVRHLQLCIDGVADGRYVARVMGVPESGDPDGPVVVIVAPDIWPDIDAAISQASGREMLWISREEIEESLRLYDPDAMEHGG